MVLQVQNKNDGNIKRIKSRYFVGEDVRNILSTETLETYSTVFQWYTVMLMLIVEFILGFQSKMTDSKNVVAQMDSTRVEKFSSKFPGISRVMEGNTMLFSC